MDDYLLHFVKNNWITLYVLITALKGVAIMTPSVKDDKIVSLITNLYDVLRTGKAPERIDAPSITDDH